MWDVVDEEVLKTQESYGISTTSGTQGNDGRARLVFMALREAGVNFAHFHGEQGVSKVGH